jgi:hypothetical protein
MREARGSATLRIGRGECTVTRDRLDESGSTIPVEQSRGPETSKYRARPSTRYTAISTVLNDSVPVSSTVAARARKGLVRRTWLLGYVLSLHRQHRSEYVCKRYRISNL